MSEQPTFEQALKQLEDAVARLEQGSLPLDEALTSFEAGVQSANQCRKMLQQVETQVEVLVKQTEGGFATEAFPEDDSSED
ncbi:MAG: exodeoxyribonuclease VII small subunit [Desulfuromonadales bacterium]|jgi:exodeoxyribonuclease VII small subunit|nr:exodeoxyribonuclease VII small subunit [Desulfuromonadales bacterium]